ncbi:MAG TPA: 30S ribosomal protein S9 [Candidatus Nanoarchaeia archaeon]|nr:30S ribosomal protein S9 [Candidatus Nanoarchaeia archaeon]
MVSKVIQASGKRKSAIARATLKKGNGVVHINNVRLEAVNDRLLGMRIGEPLTLIGERAAEFDISVDIMGGGPTGQAEAARLAIARALVSFDNKFKKIFDGYDRLLLVADVRRKEQRKPGRKSKARSKTQKSYR